MPKALRNAVTIPAHLETYWTAFWDLIDDRQMSMAGPGGIPFTAISEWATRYGVDDRDDFDRLKRIINTMDGVWMEAVRKKS